MGAARVPRVDRRRALEEAIEQAIAALDSFDGDADIEPSLGAPESPPLLFRPHSRTPKGKRFLLRLGDQRIWSEGGDSAEREDVSEDEGGACEDDGVETDSEPETSDWCNWQDEGDQSQLRLLRVYTAPRRRKAE